MPSNQPNSTSNDNNHEDLSNIHSANLYSLPFEIILKIFGYLDPAFLSRTVSRVCKRFAEILGDEVFWKCKLLNQLTTHDRAVSVVTHPVNYGLNERPWWCGRDLLWRNLSVQFGILEEKWYTKRSLIKSNSTANLHYAPVDTIKFLSNGTLIVSGGRDRTIIVSKVDDTNLTARKVNCAVRGHDGWIWDFAASDPDQFYSCGWDNQVNFWSLSHGLERISQYNCRKPVMSISSTPGLLAAGLHTPQIVLIDPRMTSYRDSEPNIATFDYHRRTITDVLLLPQRNLLLSISEDRSLIYFDLRQHRPLKTVFVTDDTSFPRRMSIYRNMLYIGDARGKIYFHSIEDDTLKIPPVFLGQTRLITAVQPLMSCVVAGSTAGFVKIFYPSNPPVYVWEQTFNGEVTCVDQHGDLLAVTSASNILSLFRPTSV
ncbi:hypothetical protein O3M35_004272 [Rhynocoris fuscipes]|uniref:F-box domain-containing protein n=1 Tax=Rhynocoris fuscipes TaxID=488301 RepID=A0AAW1CIV2_9HEMI